MKKKIFITIVIACIFSCFAAVSNSYAGSYKSEYSKQYSKSEKDSICRQLQHSKQSTPSKPDGLGNGVIPDDVLMSIYNTTKSISDSVMLISILGDTLMCHAGHAAKNQVTILGVKLFHYPDISIWICGAVIYFFGFMLVLSITFYVIDISFKLGFAIILMPIGIALWPFDKTKDKLIILISIFLKSAAIFSFLAIMVAYTLGMLSESLGGLQQVFEAIATNNTDLIADSFTLDAGHFLLVVTALAYGMKLIGSTIPEYVDKFFPDKAFGGASPMHHLSTQAMDFAKKKVVQPVASLTHDIVKTQAGRLTEGAGNLLQGKYHGQITGGIKNIGVAIRNPKETLQKAQLAAANAEAKAIGGAMKGFNNLKYGAHIAASNVLIGGKQNRAALKEQLRNERDAKNQEITDTINENYKDARKPIDDAITKNEAVHDAHKQAQKQQRQADRQQWHNEHMAKDSIYRAGAKGFQAVKDAAQDVGETIENIDAKRQVFIGKKDAQLKNIDKAKEDALIKTEKMYQKMDDFAEKIKSGKGSARLMRGITNLQTKINNSIDSGKFAKDKSDTKTKKVGKAIVRGALKLVPNTLAVAAKIPTGIVSGTVNGAVNVVNTAAKLTAGSVVGGIANNAIRAYYNVQKIAPGVQKTAASIPNAFKNIWKVPGVILSKTGEVMQDNKPVGEKNPRTPKDDDEDED